MSSLQDSGSYHPPSARPGDYDFILNPSKPKRKSLLPSGNSPIQRILIIVGFLLVLIIVLVLFMKLFLGGQNNTDKLIGLAQEQAEIIRVSDKGILTAREAATKNLAISTKLSVQSDQNSTIARLQKLGRKMSAKDLALKANTQTDQKLDSANINSKFDETFVQIIQSLLTNYRSNLKSLYDSTSNKTEKQFLATGYNSSGMLLKQTLPPK